MYIKVNKSLNFFKNFLTKNTIPIPFKKWFFTFIISKVLYYAPLLGSNKKRTSRVQSLIYKGMLWFIGYSSKDNDIIHKDKVKNSYISMYALTRDLRILLLAVICPLNKLNAIKNGNLQIVSSKVTLNLFLQCPQFMDKRIKIAQQKIS